MSIVLSLLCTNSLEGVAKGATATPMSPGIKITWLPTPSPLRDCHSFFPCPVGTTEGSQVISIPGDIGVVVNHFRDTFLQRRDECRLVRLRLKHRDGHH